MGSGSAWLFFNLFVLGMLALDLGVFHRKSHEVKFKEALGWSAAWITLALLFDLGIWYFVGREPALEFLTGYLIEKSLSVDNIFVFLMIFGYFRVPPIHQHRILFWGILGALLMRAAFIFAGIALIHRFHWLIYVFGAFLVFTGVKMALHRDSETNPQVSPLLRALQARIPVSKQAPGGAFFTVENGRRLATPFFVCLIFVEISDVIFAVDSIPAILAVTDDPFIVYTSNVFAILGLRSLYFALARFAQMFEYLHYGLAAVLAFVGIKMLLADVYKIPSGPALGVVGVILLFSVVASVLKNRRNQKANQKKG